MKKSTSIKIEEDIWNKFKLQCVQRKIKINTALEDLIRKDVSERFGDKEYFK